LVWRDQKRAQAGGEVFSFGRPQVELHLAGLEIPGAPIVEHRETGDAAFRVGRRQVGAPPPDDSGYLKLKVQRLAARRNRDVVAETHYGRSVRKIENREVVPLGLHIQAAALAGGTHVLLER